MVLKKKKKERNDSFTSLINRCMHLTRQHRQEGCTEDPRLKKKKQNKNTSDMGDGSSVESKKENTSSTSSHSCTQMG